MSGCSARSEALGKTRLRDFGCDAFALLGPPIHLIRWSHSKSQSDFRARLSIDHLTGGWVSSLSDILRQGNMYLVGDTSRQS